MDDKRWTEGVCSDGAAILYDGFPQRIGDVLDILNESDARIATMEAENARLRRALEDVAQSQPIWNGGVAPHKAAYLLGYLEEIRMMARDALAPALAPGDGS